jgi:tRNA uridine 5-carboxymethylaminomethyl modification enzyme
MFTSRAEHRLLLREDNADLRLTPVAIEMGLISEEQKHYFDEKKVQIKALQEKFRAHFISLKDQEAVMLQEQGVTLSKECRIIELLMRPEVSVKNILTLPKVQAILDENVMMQALEQVEIQAKYAGYIEKQTLEIRKSAKHENTQIPDDFVYRGIPGLSTELAEKLTKTRPQTVGMASRIPGMTPAAISLILVYIKKQAVLA